MTPSGQKIVLKEQGNIAEFIENECVATLRWQAPVDLDLHCLYLRRGDKPATKGLFGFKGTTGRHIYFNNRGRRDTSPFIQLDADQGVGDTVGREGNEENIRFFDLSSIDAAIIVANIYGKSWSSFSEYDGSVLVKGSNQEFEVPLADKKKGSWCVVALLDNRGPALKLVNVNRTMKSKPKIEEFL